MLLSVLICVAGFVALLWVLRSSQVSLGLPAAYLTSLLLIHVPGAVAHLVDKDRVLLGRDFTTIGIAFTALATICFVVGVAMSHFRKTKPVPVATNRALFNRFCLLGGWACTSIAFLSNLPSISAVLLQGGAIWMLGIILALRSALRRGDAAMGLRWLAALTVYPALMLLIGGFMSFGIAAVIIVLSALLIPVRSRLRITIVASVAVVVGISVFLAYFEHRTEIRGAVWGGADMDTRIETSLGAAKDVQIFDSRNPSHLEALNLRLNQNYFVGLAASRIAAGKVDYLRGRSLWEGLLAMVPRALWPDKPVVNGSPKLVAEMTGLTLSKGTSFGVGNVMELQINFGIPGIIIGFIALGFLIGTLDRLAAVADATGRLGDAFLFFLPVVALIQPNGSVVDMASGAAAAVAAGFAWRWAWERFSKPIAMRATPLRRRPSPQAS